jgi:transposase
LQKLRPTSPVEAVQVQLAHQHLDDIRALDAKMKTLQKQIAALVEQTGTGVTDLFGIGSLVAGRILAEIEDIARFGDKDRFASYNGAAPIDASSGEQVRYRLSRAGNRRLNRALHIMAVTQIRFANSAGRRYHERKRCQGKTAKQALRCRKRRLSDVVYRQLLADRARRIGACGSPTTAAPTPSTFTSPTIRRPVRTRPRRRTRRPGSPGSSRSTGTTIASSESRFSTPAAAATTTSSSKPNTSTDRRTPRRRSTPVGGSAAANTAAPQPTSRLAAGHPKGAGLDAGEDDATMTQPNHRPALDREEPIARDLRCLPGRRIPLRGNLALPQHPARTRCPQPPQG